MKRFKPMRKMLMLALTALVSMPLNAEYVDAINLPALQMDTARQSLLLDIVDTGSGLVTVGERGHILVSGDTGGSWHQSDVPTRLQLNAVYFADEKTGWAVGEDELILRTNDGGRHWVKQHQRPDAETKGPLLDLLFKDRDEGFAIGVFNKLLHTADGGVTWETWQGHIDNLDEWHLIAIASTDEHIYIASEMGLLFHSEDGGQSFAPLQTDHDGSFHGILARRGSDGLDRLLLVGVGGILYTSVDGGMNWRNLETGTEAGLASATWLLDGSALIVGADGVVIRVDPSLQTLQKQQTESGLALSSVVQLDNQKALMVGFGGVHHFSLD